MINTMESNDDKEIAREASVQINRPVDIEKVHISLIRASDTVFHEGKVRTVCKGNLKNDSFMGPTLFGDSYNLGRKPVYRLAMKRALPSLNSPKQ